MAETRTITEVIPDALAGQRIDRVVSMAAGVSRREAADMLSRGLVTVDGQPPDKPSTRVEVDSVVVMAVPDVETGLSADPAVDVTVVHADDDVIVVDKPAGLVVHPGSGVNDGTLIQGLLALYPQIGALTALAGQAERPGVVHRLDRGTSGLLVVAATEGAHRALVAQFAARTVGRLYRALVSGTVESDAGLIDAPLGRSPRDPTRRAVVADGKPARTRYRVDRRYQDPDCTLVECRLETGRTHQIRAHVEAIGHPIVGDERYRGPDLGLGLTRPFLHAAELGFDHPTTGVAMSFRSELPDDLARMVDALNRRNQR